MALAQLKHETAIHEDSDGVLRVGETRVTLDIVILAFHEGASPEEIAWRLDSLRLADVYAAISYYLQHRAELDAYLGRREEEADELRREINAHWQKSELRKELLAARANR